MSLARRKLILILALLLVSLASAGLPLAEAVALQVYVPSIRRAALGRQP